jgi:hypothetical protein
MKSLAVILSLLSLAVLAPCAVSAGETNAELNAVIRAIHNDLLVLKANCPCLTNYAESCLWEADGNSAISYLPPDPSTAVIIKGLPSNTCINNLRQWPEQIDISYDEINHTNGFKYFNGFENIAVCRFPTLQKKISGMVFLYISPNTQSRDLIIKVIEMECAKLHRQIDSRKSD